MKIHQSGQIYITSKYIEIVFLVKKKLALIIWGLKVAMRDQHSNHVNHSFKIIGQMMLSEKATLFNFISNIHPGKRGLFWVDNVLP